MRKYKYDECLDGSGSPQSKEDEVELILEQVEWLSEAIEWSQQQPFVDIQDQRDSNVSWGKEILFSIFCLHHFFLI